MSIHAAHAFTCPACRCTRECDGDCFTCAVCGFVVPMEDAMSDEIPEPLTFTGGPNETGLIVGRSTGPRRTEGRCPVCGEVMPERPFFGDATCGKTECRDAAVRR